MMAAPIKNKFTLKKLEDTIDINLVDYQLNGDFKSSILNITEKFNAKIKVYTYYHNPFFNKISSSKNYFYLLLNKN